MKRIVVAALLLAAVTLSAMAQDMMGKKSLYERLGGQPAIEAVVKEFAGRVLADPRLNKKFAKSNAPRLLKNLTDFVCSATGGPCTYNGLNMMAAHKNMGVTQGEFEALVGHLVDTLNKFNVQEAEQKELLGALGPLAKDMVENPSKATGTDLPSAFKPAPPLTLYERLGGQKAIEAVVNDFAGRVLKDDRINKKFAKSNVDRLLKNLIDFVCSATGGPCKYEGFNMKKAHKKMAVTQGEFNALVENLAATLNHFKVAEAEQKELVAALGPLAADIVEVKSNATGTELPKDFKPAPPLKKKKKGM